jgi:twitching motility two-component system response regulator PilG
MLQEDSSAVRLLSYSELILTLQDLCKEKQSGVMIVISESGGTAKLTLEQGDIFDVNFGGINGKVALLQIKKIIQAKVSFFKRAQGIATPHIDLSTSEILQVLADKSQLTQHQPNSPPTQFQVANNEQMVIIEAILASIIGSVARIIYQDYKEELQRAANLDALGVVIEKIVRQVLAVEQQKVFKQGIRDFIHLRGLKEQKLILNALNSAFQTSKISTTTLSLCISKQAVHGELGAVLLTKLASQLEYADNLVGVVPFFDLLRFLEKTTKTGLLTIESKGKKAAIYFDKGVLINAVEANKHGVSVAIDVLQWELDTMNFVAREKLGVAHEINQTAAVLTNSLQANSSKENAQKYNKSIKDSLSTNEIQTAITKEITRLQNKKYDAAQAAEAEYVALMAKAILLAESYDNTGAEQLFARILQDHDDSYHAWLWLSRVTSNMSVIEFALKKAGHIDSKKSQLADEVKKFTVARKAAKSDFVLRCPFCWMPVKEKDHECPNCLAGFFIDSAFFNKLGKAKTEVLDKAISRYNDALHRNVSNSNNVYLLFYLAMAYLNRQYHQEGLAQLCEITNLIPENRAFLQQKNLLTSYMQTAGLISTPAQTARHSLATGRILIVEDSAVTRKVIARTLTNSGYEVFEAKDANEALMDIGTRNLDLVLLDIILPSRDGYEILAEIRKIPHIAKIPVVMLTSRDSLFDKLKGKVSDANEYLTKPFQPDELLSVVKKYLK